MECAKITVITGKRKNKDRRSRKGGRKKNQTESMCGREREREQIRRECKQRQSLDHELIALLNSKRPQY